MLVRAVCIDKTGLLCHRPAGCSAAELPIPKYMLCSLLLHLLMLQAAVPLQLVVRDMKFTKK